MSIVSAALLCGALLAACAGQPRVDTRGAGMTRVPGATFRMGTDAGRFSFRGFNGEGRINAVKLLIVLVYSFAVLAIFQEGGQVEWRYGLLLAIGQMFGAWVAARFAADHPKSKIWIRYLLIAVVLASIGKLGWDLAV